MKARIAQKDLQAMRQEAARLGWPVAFQKDLEHDAATLRRYCPSEFGWILYPTGTFLVWHEQTAAWTDAVIRHMVRYAHETGKVRWYWWNGQALEEVTPEEMKQRLSQMRDEVGQQAA